MKIKFNENNFFINAKVSGKLNAENYQDFIKQLKSKVSYSSKDIVLDLTNLDYISSAGLRAILIIAKELDNRGNKLIICGLSESIENIFNLSGFNEIFPIYDNINSVLQIFQSNK